MLNKNNERELVYVVKVNSVNELPGYDRVERATINGWNCIVPKGQFKDGDLGIYFEIDSKVPATEPFEFMAKRKYRVKTQRMCGSISQGLLMHPSDFGWGVNENGLILNPTTNTFYEEGTFLTKELGVIYYDPEDNRRKASHNSVDKYKKMQQRNKKLFSHQPYKWLMEKEWGKKLLFFFYGEKKKNNIWPAWVVKTDEERIQNMPWVLEDNNPWIATEKIDGSSTTFTMLKKGHKFYVCSRNVCFNKENSNHCYYDTNIYTEMAEKYDMENVLKKLFDEFPSAEWITIQGETYGKKVQNRDYSIDGHDFRAFNLITSSLGRLNSSKAAEVLDKYGIDWVPIIDKHYFLPKTVDEVLEYVEGKSVLDDGMREGIVFRSLDGKKSFKAVSNNYLMKYHS